MTIVLKNDVECVAALQSILSYNLSVMPGALISAFRGMLEFKVRCGKSVYVSLKMNVQ